jgi:hypothetical protein
MTHTSDWSTAALSGPSSTLLAFCTHCVKKYAAEGPFNVQPAIRIARQHFKEARLSIDLRPKSPIKSRHHSSPGSARCHSSVRFKALPMRHDLKCMSFTNQLQPKKFANFCFWFPLY